MLHTGHTYTTTLATYRSHTGHTSATTLDTTLATTLATTHATHCPPHLPHTRYILVTHLPPHLPHTGHTSATTLDITPGHKNCVNVFSQSNISIYIFYVTSQKLYKIKKLRYLFSFIQKAFKYNIYQVQTLYQVQSLYQRLIKMYKYRKSSFNFNSDELLNITELDCSYCEITSFKGLNAPNLTKLVCRNNMLTSLEGLNAPNLTHLDFQLKLLEGLNAPNSTSLDCQLSLFEGLNAPNLTTLVCYSNQLTSFEKLNAPNLTYLNCSYCNKLRSFEGLNAPNLTTLVCHNNKLTSFKGLNAPNLNTLVCYVNHQLSSLEGLNAPNLTYLDCHFNQLSSFEGLNAPYLHTLICHNNKLTTFEGLNAPILTTLCCRSNKLASFEGLNAPHLINLDCSDNEWEHIPPHINRLLNQVGKTQGVYGDGQNVHNHHIQESIRTSIQNVLAQKPTITNITEYILSDMDLEKQTKEILVEYMNDESVHSTLKITFKELAEHVFSRIEVNEHCKEIKRVLNTEMIDSLCKCFTGRMSRLINSLNGFDKLVKVEISETEQIGTIVSLIRERLESLNKYTVVEHRKETEKEMKERGYTQDKIEEWVKYIE
jgi:Leucine-rich repeat (LRR) protein